MACSATSLRTLDYPAIVILPVVVHYAPHVFHPSRRPTFSQFFLMKFVVERRLGSADVPVHVLIIVVGAYLRKQANLTDAGGFAQTIVDFWLEGGRIFPDNQKLSTIEVLASDPSGLVSITGEGAAQGVDLPCPCRKLNLTSR
jgi:hypothetical protein